MIECNNYKRGETSWFGSGDEHCAISVDAEWHRSSIFSKCFCKSRQFIFGAPCQYIPRCRHPEYTRNSCGFAVLDGCQISWWVTQKMGKQMFGRLFLCQPRLQPNVTRKLRLRCLQDKVWSADCGFKPNGHAICHLLPTIIKPPTLGQTLCLYLDSHRVRRSWYCETVILLVFKIKMIYVILLLCFYSI